MRDQEANLLELYGIESEHLFLGLPRITERRLASKLKSVQNLLLLCYTAQDRDSKLNSLGNQPSYASLRNAVTHSRLEIRDLCPHPVLRCPKTDQSAFRPNPNSRLLSSTCTGEVSGLKRWSSDVTLNTKNRKLAEDQTPLSLRAVKVFAAPRLTSDVLDQLAGPRLRRTLQSAFSKILSDSLVEV